MYDDLRIRSSNRLTPIPPKYKAYIFRCYLVDSVLYKVILAPSLVIANQRLRDFSISNDLDFFWTFVQDDDFEVVYLNNVIPK